MVIDKFKAFTLVELLIVLSIVAILAMVGEPRMIESKLLSKLTQISYDQRLIQVALDAYFLDYGGYPRDQDSAWPHPIAGEQDGFVQLTTPIRYLSKVMEDAFGYAAGSFSVTKYEGGSGSDELGDFAGLPHGACGNASSKKQLYRNPAARLWGSSSCLHAYLIISMGPDHEDTTVGNDNFPYGITQLHSYSPTNGSESKGDIYRLTGQYRRGNVTLDGIPITSLIKQTKKGGQ